jgi:hypothetical protein
MLSICLEYSLIGRFNRLLARGGPSHLTSLSVHMAPDDVEDTRMQVLELWSLRLVELSLHHRAPYRPLIAAHFPSARFWLMDVDLCACLHIGGITEGRDHQGGWQVSN